MVVGAWLLVSRLAAAAVVGLQLLAAGLLAAVLGVGALASTVIGVAGRLIGAMAGELARLVGEALPWLLAAAPWLARAAVVIGVMLVVVWAWPALYGSYGADMAAPAAAWVATMVVAAPVMLAVLRRDWALLLLAAAVIVGLAAVLIRVGPGGRALAVLTPLAVLVMMSVFEKGNDDDELSEYDEKRGHEPVEEPDADRPDRGDGVHDVELPQNDDGAGGSDGRDPGADRVRGGDDLLGEVLQRHGAEQ